jgi:serine/threonine protein kinase/formylglycine-generating enzyme required for sulfatase activity
MARPTDQPPDDEATRVVDQMLAEGLQKLDAGDSTGWRQFVSQHPQHASELEQRALSLQRHGFYTDQLLTRRLGPYSLGSKIGQGGMGIVYRAVRDGETREVALKVMRGDFLASSEARVRLQREVDGPSALAHPGIVRVVDADLESPIPWLAMELIDAPSLAQLIGKAREHGMANAGQHFQSPAGALADGPTRWWRGILAAHVHALEALQVAHDHGLLHRDLKPSNLLVPRDAKTVLIDFGLARNEDTTTITRSGATVGSLAYMAPELLSHRGRATPASDLYSLGVTLFQALALQLPFPGEGAEALRAAILTGERARLSDLSPSVPAALDTVLACAMAPEPHLRYADAAAFARDLQAILDVRPVQARPAGTWLTTRRWARRHPTKAMAAAAATLFAMAVPAAMLWAKDAELRRVQILSDLHLVAELEQHAARLWPERIETVTAAEGMDVWLRRADEVLSRRATHQAELRDVRSLGRQLPPTERDVRNQEARRLVAELEQIARNQNQALTQQPASYQDWFDELEENAEPIRRRLIEVEGWDFPDPEANRRHRYLAELELGLGRIEALRTKVLQRRQRALDLHRRSLVDGNEAWQAVLAEIADVGRNPAYRGLRLAPQPGLLPLGKDPQSGLFEFAHLASGEPATRDATGRLLRTDRSGLVHVLLPGGTTRIGADPEPNGAQPDSEVDPEDAPSIPIRLDPFFLSKFEMTQAQWVRQRGHNNCLHKPGPVKGKQALPITPLHPADFVSHQEALEILAQLDLELPTGAQWEYAARGGTTTSLWTGGDAASLDGKEQMLDVEGLAGSWPPGTHIQPADGWPFHAPVGSFAANPFGLFDVLGNVLEWCVDTPRSYTLPLRDGDGRGESLDHGGICGSCFFNPATGCRVTTRNSAFHNATAAGLRPMRRIEGDWRCAGGK